MRTRALTAGFPTLGVLAALTAYAPSTAADFPDQEEALTISDRVAVMNSGGIEQFAGPGELFRCPASPFVEAFVCDTIRGAVERLERAIAGVIAGPST
jgi:hypothetical protein